MEEKIQLSEEEARMPPAELLKVRPDLAKYSRTTIWRARVRQECRKRGYRESVVQPDSLWNARHQGWVRTFVERAFGRLWEAYWGIPRSLKDQWQRDMAQEVMDYLLNQTGKDAWKCPRGKQRRTPRDCANFVRLATFNAMRKAFNRRCCD